MVALRSPVLKPSCRVPLASYRCPDAAAFLCLSYLLVGSLVVAALGLGPLCHCCIPGLSNISSRTLSWQHLLRTCPLRRATSSRYVLSSCDGQFLPLSTVSMGPKFSEKFPFSPCHFCTARHLLAGDNQLLPGSTTSPDPFPQFLAALRGQILDHTVLPQSSDRHYCSIFLGDFLTILYGCIIPGSGSVSVSPLQAVFSFRSSFKSVSHASRFRLVAVHLGVHLSHHSL